MPTGRPFKPHLPPILIALCVLLCCAVAPARAGDEASAQQHKLEQLRSRIQALQARMERDVDRRGSVQGELRRAERAIAAAAAGLRELDGKVAAANKRLVALKRQQAQKQAALDGQKAALAAQIRAAYAEGSNSELQMLLNAEDPATLGRMLAYYDYLNQARATRIRAVREELRALTALNRQVEQQLADISALRDQRARALAQMQSERDARKRTLAKLNGEIHDRGAQLARLQRDARSIEDLLANLQQALSDIPADLEKTRDFARLRGRLAWPVSGKLLHRFGEPLVGDRLPAQGDLIAAPMGTPVHAVAWGRVVYADWLPRFGLLVILDHGHGYLSIYAHNQSLYAQVGDWVQPGQRIATLGDSGGQAQPALYFELRHNNTSLNPRKWCRGRP
ncbi:MAG TPA: peptidoglycan DD-metalloendopeptidase family protein [Gammaproteobacteria bacterium]|nr:peptidoglycan DD-metalloendopeptidase family protein [Gammaproteobacteria bacterium]